MIDLKTKLAKAAWDLGPISKTMIPSDILQELISDFEKLHDVEIVSVEKIEDLNTFTVVVKGKECLDLYSDWMEGFEAHGYEPPFLVVDNNRSCVRP